MFCPKCGTQNSNEGKFCRKCGTDLKVVSDAIKGENSSATEKKKENNLEGAFGSLFGGLAFLAIAIILFTTNIIGGQNWAVWLLIPAFGGIGIGIAKFIQLRQDAKEKAIENTELTEAKQKALPPNQTEYIAPDSSKYQTGDLVPPSIVENTTKHLEMDSEGETMTLPKDKV